MNIHVRSGVLAGICLIVFGAAVRSRAADPASFKLMKKVTRHDITWTYEKITCCA